MVTRSNTRRVTVSTTIRIASWSALPRRIGLFEVSEIDTPGDSVRFVVGDAFIDSVGVVYSPGGTPPLVGEDSSRHLHGSWWMWYRRW
jgi:hypothetical protein